jgi:F420-dependent oxidoreductase-like protein
MRVKIGLHIPNFTWPGGPAKLGEQLATVARTADEVGFHTISVMDHFFQIGVVGPPEQEMLEAYTTLGFLAAHTTQARLLTLVTGVVYREPAVLAKAVTTLDVLSGGRAWLGIGAAWNEEESRALGIPFPDISERFERLEEALQIVQRMWSDDDSEFRGPFHTLTRPLNSPQPLTKPHPPILIGGMGERKTLRLVAKYGDACNLFAQAGSDVLRQKLAVLREHCAREGRDFDDIYKTVTVGLDPGPDGSGVGPAIAQLRELAELGFQTAIISNLPNVWELRPLEIIGKEIIPAIADL